MAEKKGVGHAYNIDFLNVVFAASSLFLFFTTLWMVWDDYDRDWKNYQRRFVQLETEVTRQNLEQAQGNIDQAKFTTLQAERTQAEQDRAANQQKIDALEDQLDAVDADLYRAQQDYQFQKAKYDAERYEYEALREEDPEDAEAMKAGVDEMYQTWLELGLRVEAVTAERDGIRAQIGTFTNRVNDINGQIRELTTETSRLQGRLDALAPNLVTSYLLNAPLMDFMAPTLRVRQVITPTIVDDVNFTRVPKMDRCMTCHLAIDRVGYQEYPQPFRTHPDIDVYVGPASPHPLETTGCTVCHEGMGQSITFRDASHTPVGEEQTLHWEEEFDWEEPHLWDFPMLPKGMTEASCAKCHREQVFVPHADVLNTAYGMYERAGCYACHKSRGFEGLRRPGPNLTRIKAKLTPDWVARWIRDPRAIKPSTWMPRVWYNSNTKAPEDAKRNEAEIDAVVAYLFAHSGDHQFAVAAPPRGDPENGRQIVESVGCLACHITGAETRAQAGPRRTFGQPLQNIGNKTTFEWLFDWIRDPKHYSPATYMPDLRLTDREAADVATYLMTLRGGEGESAKATYDTAFTDEALLDYMRSVVPTEEARATMATMSSEERKLELGRRAIGRYGCYSCHEIKGFEQTQPIGIELSEEGSKLLPRLDFAFVDIPHTKVEWFKQKLHDPRTFDYNRVLQPLEKLRMPDFGFSEEEATWLATAIMSFQSQVQPLAAHVPRSARNDTLGVGRNLLRRRNCVACHEIEGAGGDYRAIVKDPSLAPPLLTPEGAKVQPDWLYAFLRGPITIRPWLRVRMPTFGLDDTQWNQVLDYFAAVSDVAGPFRTHEIQPSPANLQVGRELFGLLQCQACHVLDTIPADRPTDNLAPDLRMASERLQPDWILDWLRSPLSIQPGTRMPMFWPDHPKSPFPQLGGDAPAQIEAIRNHLLTFRGGPSPRQTN